jgi:hypothetical protein
MQMQSDKNDSAIQNAQESASLVLESLNAAIQSVAVTEKRNLQNLADMYKVLKDKLTIS